MSDQQTVPPGVDPNTGEVLPNAPAERAAPDVSPPSRTDQMPPLSPAPAPEPPAEEKKPQQPTDYVVCFAVSPNDEDGNEVVPKSLAPLAKVPASNIVEAKRKALAQPTAQGEALRASALKGELWLVAIPARSFKLKRVTPKAPAAPEFSV